MTKQTMKLHQMNNALDRQVNEENQVPFTDMVCYLRSADISEEDQEIVRHDLLDMILSAQERGEDLQTVIGDDYKSFCDHIIANLPPKSRKQKIIEGVNILSWCLSILFAINIITANDTITLIKNMFTRKALNFNISISLGNIISIAIVFIAAVAIVKYITKNSFSIGKMEKSTKIKGILFTAAAVIIFLLIAWAGRKTLFHMNIFAALFLVFVLYAVHKIMERL